jgi:DNA-binding Lrp family transcriptional regulator
MGENKFIGQIQEYNRYAQGSVAEAIKLDLTDRKILYLLHKNARLSTTYLSKELRLKRETIAYRIKRMTDAGFLHGYLTMLDHRKLGFKNYRVCIKLKTLTNEKEMLNHLKGIAEVMRLKNCSGSYDMQLVFSVRHEEEFLALFDNVINKYHQNIQSYDVMQIIDEDFLGLSLVLDEEERKKIRTEERKGSTFQKEFDSKSAVEGEAKLDAKDIQILEALKLDGRIGVKTICQKVDLAPNAVKARIASMARSGVIKRFMPLASLSMLGYQWWMVFLKFNNLDKKRFFTFIEYHPNILWYMRLLGKWDYQISVFAKDNAEFHKVIDELRTEFAENMMSYDPIIIFNQMKYVQRVR